MRIPHQMSSRISCQKSQRPLIWRRSPHRSCPPQQGLHLAEGIIPLVLVLAMLVLIIAFIYCSLPDSLSLLACPAFPICHACMRVCGRTRAYWRVFDIDFCAFLPAWSVSLSLFSACHKDEILSRTTRKQEMQINTERGRREPRCQVTICSPLSVDGAELRSNTSAHKYAH
jgi:hypothetical protein